MTRPLALVLVLVLGLSALADDQALRPADVLAAARARYDRARELYATYEGVSAVYGQTRPFTGSLAFRRPDAARYELRFNGDDPRRQIWLREGERERKWQVRGKEVTITSDRNVKGEVKVPLIPAFDGYDEKSLKFVEIRRELGKPDVYVVEAPAVARLGIEDGTWHIRTLDLLNERGEAAMSVKFLEVKIDAGFPVNALAPPSVE